MKRITMIAAVCAALVLVTLVLWLVARRGGPEIAPLPPDTGAAKPAGEATLPVAVSVSELPVRVAFFGGDEFGPGYVDFETRTFFRWNGVVLHREQLRHTPYYGRVSRIAPLDAKDFTVKAVEGPLAYLETNGGFRPGYRDRAIDAFYEWKGIVLNKAEVPDKGPNGQSPIFQPGVPDRGSPLVIEIEIPTHLKDRPNDWKKS